MVVAARVDEGKDGRDGPRAREPSAGTGQAGDGQQEPLGDDVLEICR